MPMNDIVLVALDQYRFRRSRCLISNLRIVIWRRKLFLFRKHEHMFEPAGASVLVEWMIICIFVFVDMSMGRGGHINNGLMTTYALIFTTCRVYYSACRRGTCCQRSKYGYELSQIWHRQIYNNNYMAISLHILATCASHPQDQRRPVLMSEIYA